MAESSDVPPPQAVDSVLSKYQLIPISKVKPSRHQARKRFDEESLKALASSIKAEGLIEPIVVQPVGEVFELISGERRLRACKLNGMETIEAKVIQPISEASAAAKGLIENLQRENLNPIEEAEGFDELNRLDPVYWTHEQIAKVAGPNRTRGYITQSIGLLRLPEQVKADVSALTLTRSQALELTRLPDAANQLKVADQIKTGKLGRDQARKIIDDMLGGDKKRKRGGDMLKVPPAPPTAASPAIPDPLAAVWPELKDKLGLFMEWQVEYGKYDAGSGVHLWGWYFFVRPNREEGGGDLANLLLWFQKMRQGLASLAKPEDLKQAALLGEDAQEKPLPAPAPAPAASSIPSTPAPQEPPLDPKVAEMVARVKARRAQL